MKFVILCFVLLGICHTSIAGWQNSWDQKLDYSCPSGQHVYRIKSYHDNGKEDRRWEIFCRKGYVKEDECSFTSDYVNGWDNKLDYTCPDNGIVTGLYSVHDNGKEDRRWKVRCCKLAVKKGTSCYTTGYINDWDRAMDHRVNNGQAIVGLYSHHDNGKEDRKWKLKVCSFTTCHAKKMKILDVLRPTHTGRFIIGITAETGCSTDKHTPNLGQETAYTESTSFTTTDSKEFNFGTTLSVEVETSAKLFGAGVAVTYGVSASFGGAITTEKSKTTSESLTTAQSSSTGVEYNGPASVLIVGWKDDYEFNTNNINVEYDIECDNGSKYKERGKVNLSAKSYGKTHFTKRVARFGKQSDCTWSVEQCVQNIDGTHVVDVERVINSFSSCFPNGIATIAK